MTRDEYASRIDARLILGEANLDETGRLASRCENLLAEMQALRGWRILRLAALVREMKAVMLRAEMLLDANKQLSASNHMDVISWEIQERRGWGKAVIAEGSAVTEHWTGRTGTVTGSEGEAALVRWDADGTSDWVPAEDLDALA